MPDGLPELQNDALVEVAAKSTPEGRTTYRPKNKRHILCVFPQYAPSFGTFQHSYKLFPDVNAFMPPQGMLLVVAYMPIEWEVRFIDENRQIATEEDFKWADAVFISGMHVQRGFIGDINRRAHAHNKITALGGPSVSSRSPNSRGPTGRSRVSTSTTGRSAISPLP